MLRLVLLVLDFDGTVADADTIDLLAERLAPAEFAAADADLAAGRIGLDEAIARELGAVRATREEALAILRAEVRPRPGLPELLALCAERFVEPVIVSSGLRGLIEPLLVAWGLGDVAVRAHDGVFTPEGVAVRFRPLPVCELCGERCKRYDVRRLADGRRVAYVGDGHSDLCAARSADLVFARAALAADLGADGHPFVPFADFHDVRAGLESDLR